MDETPAAGKSRDPERSRESILNAAEQLFAEHGYDAVSIQMIGERAGVSRGTPGYFFGSKEALYAAVLARIFAAEFAFIGAAGGALSEPESTNDLSTDLGTIIGGFIEFLAQRGSFVQLLDREALAGGALLRSSPAHIQSLETANSISTSLLMPDRARPIDPGAFILAVVSMCWFPFTHAETFAGPLGIDMAKREDRDRWRTFLVDLVQHGIRQA